MHSTFTQVPEEGEKKRVWESPQLIELNLNRKIEGNPANLFEDTNGIAYANPSS